MKCRSIVGGGYGQGIQARLTSHSFIYRSYYLLPHVGAVTVNVSSADASSWVRSIGDTWDLRPWVHEAGVEGESRAGRWGVIIHRDPPAVENEWKYASWRVTMIVIKNRVSFYRRRTVTGRDHNLPAADGMGRQGSAGVGRGPAACRAPEARYAELRYPGARVRESHRRVNSRRVSRSVNL